MDNIYVYCVPLPDGVNEMVTPCADGYTVYIDVHLDKEHRIDAYNHAVRHVTSGDFEKTDVQMIESVAHS